MQKKKSIKRETHEILMKTVITKAMFLVNYSLDLCTDCGHFVHSRMTRIHLKIKVGKKILNF